MVTQSTQLPQNTCTPPLVPSNIGAHTHSSYPFPNHSATTTRVSAASTPFVSAPSASSSPMDQVFGFFNSPTSAATSTSTTTKLNISPFGGIGGGKKQYTVAITGSTGMIGQALIKSLRANTGKPLSYKTTLSFFGGGAPSFSRSDPKIYDISHTYILS